MASVSIIIPAHNESAVIGRCLRSILDGAAPDELEIIVVCNGCKDDTAAIARSFGPCVRVIETDVPSKANALNLGDRAATAFPRFFVDADIVLPIDSIRQTTAVLRGGSVLAAAPMMRVDTSRCAWAVRAFYQVWLSLPYARQGMIGSGVYAVSEAGRRRFDQFPKITADDAFVRLQFSAEERQTVESCHFTITPPQTLSALVAIKTRSHFGNLELRTLYPQVERNENAAHGGPLARLAVNPLNWPRLAAYLYVKVATRRRSRARLRRGDHNRWERDDTSRQPQPM
jgi:glycosyltransferase involved in cell wall biosynthesis